MYTNDKKLNLLLILTVSALWIVGLSYGSGIGQSYHIYERTMLITVVAFMCFSVLKGKFKKINRSVFFVAVYVIIHNLYTEIRYGNTYFEYIWLYLLAILLSEFKISKKSITIIGVIYGGLGFLILIVANYTAILSGWDGNSISMIGFFSYAVFAASVSEIRDIKKVFAMIVYSLVYFYLLESLNSRSSILFSIIIVLSCFRIIPMNKIIENKRATIVLLLIPLIVAIFIVTIRNMEFINQLNIWSYKTFSKPIFNGRDEIWYSGFIRLGKNILFGTGTLAGNWHNSAVTALVGWGVVGYTIWLACIKSCFDKVRNAMEDGLLISLASVYIIVWIHQTVELGLIQVRGNPILFVILGLLLGRAKMMQKQIN